MNPLRTAALLALLLPLAAVSGAVSGVADGCYCACAPDFLQPQSKCSDPNFCENWCRDYRNDALPKDSAPSQSWSQRVMDVSARTGYVDPQAAGMAVMLDTMNMFFKSGSNNADRARAEAALRAQQEAERQRREAEAEARKDAMRENLMSKLKTDGTRVPGAARGGRFDNSRVLGGLQLKTGNDTFPGARRDRGTDLAANLKRDDDDAKKGSDRVAAMELPKEPTEFERLSERYKAAQAEAQSARKDVDRLEAELKEARKKLEERRKQRAEEKAREEREAALKAEKLKRDAAGDPVRPDAPPAMPKLKADPPGSGEEKKDDKEAEAQRLLDEANADEEESKRIEAELRSAKQREKDAEAKANRERAALRAHLSAGSGAKQ